jgi:1-acyl-sn-glycerol-3-phosphate acyltransferase
VGGVPVFEIGEIVPESEMHEMKRLAWKLINMGQVLFFFLWSVIWQSIAILIRIATFSPKISLWLAHAVWAPPLIFLTGSKVHVQGREKIDFSKAHVFVCNHQSALDIAVVFKVLPVGVRFIAKKELKNIPFLGWYMQAMGMIFIDRKDPRKARESLRMTGKLMEKGANIAAFPEGTRSEDGRIQPFKKGVFVVAIQSGIPLVPIAIEGTRRVMPKNSLRVRPHPIFVSVGDPIPTENLTYDDREALTHEVRKKLVELNFAVGGLGGAERQ